MTGHSLGGALSTLFSADIGEYGIDAGRGLPQLEESEPWWNSLASNFMSKEPSGTSTTSPPRPKSLKIYNFGSPRVGNKAFVNKFDSLVGKEIDEAYRIVNGDDVVARLPRSVNALGLVSVGYEHCGPTVLISIPDDESAEDPLVWIEGQSEGECPVRDGTAMTSPLAKGSLLGDIFSAVNDGKGEDKGGEQSYLEKGDYFSKLTTAMKGRLETLSAADLPSIVGIDKKFVERESKIAQAIVSGEALSNHMEDEYYLAMGRACGFIAEVGKEIRPL